MVWAVVALGVRGAWEGCWCDLCFSGVTWCDLSHLTATLGGEGEEFHLEGGVVETESCYLRILFLLSRVGAM